MFSLLTNNFFNIKQKSMNNININEQEYLLTDKVKQIDKQKINIIKENNKVSNQNYIIILIIISIIIKILVHNIFNLYKLSKLIFWLLEFKTNFENKTKFHNTINELYYFVFKKNKNNKLIFFLIFISLIFYHIFIFCIKVIF